jgi:hypothetical protein
MRVYLLFLPFHTPEPISTILGIVRGDLLGKVLDTCEPIFYKFKYPHNILETPKKQFFA